MEGETITYTHIGMLVCGAGKRSIHQCKPGSKRRHLFSL